MKEERFNELVKDFCNWAHRVKVIQDGKTVFSYGYDVPTGDRQ